MSVNNSEWATHVHAVRRASKATHKSRTVLLYLCFMADYKAPHYVTCTKDQIAEETGVESIRHIQKMLQALKRSGTISVVRNGKGGRSVPVTYELHAQSHHKPQPTVKSRHIEISMEEFNSVLKETGGYAAGSKILDARYPQGWALKGK